MAIALTLGLIAWIEQPDEYGIDDLSRLVVAAARARARRRRRAWCARVLGLRAAAALDRRLRARRVGRRRRSLVRGGRRDRGQRLPRRLPRRPRRRQHAVPVPATARRLPRGSRLPRPGRALHRARAARLPERAARGRIAGACARVRADARRPPRSRVVSTCAARVHGHPSACCSAGRGCAAPCRSCSPRSCSPRTSSTGTRSSTPSSSSSSISVIVQGTTLEWVAAQARPALAGAARARAAARGRARSASSTWSTSSSPPITRSRAPRCASWGCPGAR